MIKITATNPKGLDYDIVVEALAEAKDLIKHIHGMGATDITMNGNIVPLAMIEAL